jgi:hypothetical protein
VLVYALTLLPLFLTVTRVRYLAIVWPDQKEAVDRVARSPLRWLVFLGATFGAAAAIAIHAN